MRMRCLFCGEKEGPFTIAYKKNIPVLSCYRCAEKKRIKEERKKENHDTTRIFYKGHAR